MGRAKEQMFKEQERGYASSDKYVCSGCVKDNYLVKYIRKQGEYGRCSFCKDEKGKPITHRKVLSLESLMTVVMPAIDFYYMDADGNIPYDKENSYMGNTVDPYDYVYEILASDMKIEDEDLLKELFDILSFDIRVSIDEFRERREELDMRAWNEFCDLVNNRSELSVEQIVSLSSTANAPKDLKRMANVIKMVLQHARKLDAYDIIHTGRTIYRCVTFHKMGYVPVGFTQIPATLVGTAPAQFAENGRFNEKGDMMFYGADSKKTAAIEVGRKDNNPFTIGYFHTNKQIHVLDLSHLSEWKLPSVFCLSEDDIQKRESWFFLYTFMQRISEPTDREGADALKVYKPIQVFTKYMQRLWGLYGIKYQSSRSANNQLNRAYGTDSCYVLFAENRDCIDKVDVKRKLNTNRLQLIMEKVEQMQDVIT